MKNKPSPELLISYLCGELQGEEKKSFEALLTASPEWAAGLEETRQLLGNLHRLPDVEAPPPPVFLEPLPAQEEVARTRPVPVRYLSRFTQAVLAVAASLTMLLVAGSLTRTRVTADGNGLAVRFGPVGEVSVPDNHSEEIRNTLAALRSEMQALKAEKAPDHSGQFYRELAGLKVSLNELNRRVAAQAKEKEVQTVAGRPRRQLSDAQMKQIMAALSDENLRLIENAFQAASEQQQRQLQESLTNFARYLDQIRAEDTELVLASIEEMDRKSEVKFRETEQVIDALLESVQTAPQR